MSLALNVLKVNQFTKCLYVNQDVSQLNWSEPNGWKIGNYFMLIA